MLLQRQSWHLELEDDGDYVIESDGRRWALSSGPPGGVPDVTIRTSTADLRQFLADPTPTRASALGIRISAAAAPTARFHRLMDAFRTTVALPSPARQRPGGNDDERHRS